MTDLTQLSDEQLRPYILGDDRDEADRARFELGRRVSEGYSSPFQYRGRAIGMLEAAAQMHYERYSGVEVLDRLIALFQQEQGE